MDWMPTPLKLLALFGSTSGSVHLFAWSPFYFTTPTNLPQHWLQEGRLTPREQKETLRIQCHRWIHPGLHLPNLPALLTVSLYTSISLTCCSEMMSSCCSEWCGPGTLANPNTYSTKYGCFNTKKKGAWFLGSWIPTVPVCQDWLALSGRDQVLLGTCLLFGINGMSKSYKNTGRSF